MRPAYGKTTATFFMALIAVASISEAVIAAQGYHIVTAQSRYGNGSVTAPVKYIRGYLHVRLPSGFWEDCAGNCREALRRNHLDFWATIDEEGPSPGR